MNQSNQVWLKIENDGIHRSKSKSNNKKYKKKVKIKMKILEQIHHYDYSSISFIKHAQSRIKWIKNVKNQYTVVYNWTIISRIK